MPLYQYQIRTESGKKITSTREAQSKEVLIELLQKEGFFVLSVDIAAKTEGAIKRRFTHSGARGSDLVIFSKQLAVMLEAGVTINKALDALLKQIDSRALFGALTQIKMYIEEGKTFAQSVAKFPKIFSKLWVSMIETGEASGKLDFVLSRLSKYLEVRLGFKNEIVSSLMYPALLFLASIGALLIFILKIIPTLSELFKSFSVELPVITRMMIGFSDFLSDKLLFIFFGAAAIIVFVWYIKRIEVVNKVMWQVLFRLPLFGNLLKILMAERFLSQMSILIESGVPMLYSLEITQNSSENPILKDIIDLVKASVRSGSPLSRPMEQSGFFAPMVIQMVNTGEQSGNLAVMLEKVSAFYEEYTRNFLVRFTRLFEPMMIILMGVGVGFLVISMYLPIFQIATLGGGFGK